MAGPLYGVGAQQQIPLTNASQQSQASQQQKTEQDKRPVTNEVQPQGAASAESKNTSSSSDSLYNLSAQQLADATEQGRGALLDVVV